MGPHKSLYNGNHYKKDDAQQQKFMEDLLNYKKLLAEVFGHVSKSLNRVFGL
jgi:hypothetical protein